MLAVFRDAVRRYLGIDGIPRMEINMASAKAQLDTLSGKVDDLIADVRAARDVLSQDRENLTADGQAALDSLTAKIDAFDAEVGDADGSDTPVVTEPGTPAEGTQQF